ncbi:MAG: N-methyl-L-tryptophan oxidase [Gemmatimonadales bacterium]
MTRATSGHADVIIVGLGAMGSSAAYHVAGRGYSVLGFDRFRPPHDRGSSGGETRIIREAYFEHPLYVPFVQHAYDLWRELEKESGKQLLTQTGGLMMGPPDGVLVTGALASARQHGLPFELLTPTQIAQRFPVFQPSDEMVGVLEPRAGFLLAELCIGANLELAQARGANLRFNEPISAWHASGSGVEVRSERGVYRAEKLVLSAGAWMAGIVGDLKLPLHVERMVLHWFEPKRNKDWFSSARLPIYVIEYAPNYLFYGFPLQPRGIKIALHHHGPETDPEDVAAVSQEERSSMLELISRYMPDAAGRIVDSATCMYTNTPDENFLIDFHPDHGNVLLASPCSGHGFKFSSAIGEILADLLTDGPLRFELEPFKIGRFSLARDP